MWVVLHAREIALGFIVFFGLCILGVITIMALEIRDLIKNHKKGKKK